MRLDHIAIVLAWLGASFGASTASADVTVTALASKDATIFTNAVGPVPLTASGRGSVLYAGTDGGANPKRSLVHFDVSSLGIPSGATITDVELKLYLAFAAGSGGGGGGAPTSRSISVFKLQQDWGEGQSGLITAAAAGPAPQATRLPASGNDMPPSGQGYAAGFGDATWDFAVYAPNAESTVWGSPKTPLHGGNFVATASATSTFNAPYVENSVASWTSAQLTDDVQAWIAAPESNFGWLLANDVEDARRTFLAFWSRDQEASALTPELVITYTTPEPSVVCGGLLGTQCPGAGICEDDPSDTCDPLMGGNDCIGICVCRPTALCPMNSHWDGSPSVCACVRDDAP